MITVPYERDGLHPRKRKTSSREMEESLGRMPGYHVVKVSIEDHMLCSINKPEEDPRSFQGLKGLTERDVGEGGMSSNT